MSELPNLTHLQFLVVGMLCRAPCSGGQVRDGLRAFGVRKSGPSFYQLMARLEDSGLVKGEYRQEVIEGQIIRERHYRITDTGARAWEGSRQFYEKAIDALGSVKGLAGA